MKTSSSKENSGLPHVLALPRIVVLTCTMATASVASAIPVLQIGAPAGSGDIGNYADYVGSSANPKENNTAITGGGTIYVAGVYQNNKVQNLGGKYGAGSDWGDYDPAFAVFNGKGAVLLAAVPDGARGTALANLTIDGASAFYSSVDLLGLFPKKNNKNHAPLKNGISDFLFFDIGSFSNNPSEVPNFDDETGAADGEIKTLSLGGTAGLDWIHFDVLALQTLKKNNGTFATTIRNDPGSHDATWKDSGDDGGTPPAADIPVPAPLALIGLGAVLLGLSRGRYAR
jgi:hypothetical protein